MATFVLGVVQGMNAALLKRKWRRDRASDLEQSLDLESNVSRLDWLCIRSVFIFVFTGDAYRGAVLGALLRERLSPLVN